MSVLAVDAPMLFDPGPQMKREPASGIDFAMVDSLKVRAPNRPIREADIFDCRRRA
ncbi:MAG: hypothetical protein JSU95_04300 [Betaproteobacteria bacterium]|nr:MAG: hypothetical protein JSU95_04300 [Betaproteobacteria bacterium]